MLAHRIANRSSNRKSAISRAQFEPISSHVQFSTFGANRELFLVEKLVLRHESISNDFEYYSNQEFDDMICVTAMTNCSHS